jgi:GxxExxY protein
VDNKNMEEYLYKEECYKIIGCAMEVHKELGCGFLELVYQEALSIVFEEKDIPYVRDKVLEISFRGKTLQKKYVADFVCFDEVIVELKALDAIHPEHLAQVLNYLKATGKKLGLIINFGTKSLQYKRVIL